MMPGTTRADASQAAAATRRGAFITFEGGEGVGKSTQVRRLVARLAKMNIETVATREPGGSPVAELLRSILLAAGLQRPGPIGEAILFAAARSDHVDRLIAPALAAGRFVVCDRFADSTRAYQGAAGGLDQTFLDGLDNLALAGLKPDLTFILDLPAEVGLARAARRRHPGAAADRFESETVDFHKALRQAFLAIAAAEPTRCIIVDAAQTEEAIAEIIWRAVEERLIDRRAGKQSHGA